MVPFAYFLSSDVVADFTHLLCVSGMSDIPAVRKSTTWTFSSFTVVSTTGFPSPSQREQSSGSGSARIMPPFWVWGWVSSVPVFNAVQTER